MKGEVVATDTDLYGPDMVLLLLAAPTQVDQADGRINGITRLEKLLFLADQEEEAQAGVQDPFKFEAYHYGPYSKAVYEAVELLEQAGLLKEERALGGEPFDEMEELETDVTDESPVERRFILTAEGQAVANLLASRHGDTSKALGRIKDRYAKMPLRQLIRYVYTRYPAFAEKSRIRSQVI